jgi:hypothetical protein
MSRRWGGFSTHRAMHGQTGHAPTSKGNRVNRLAEANPALSTTREGCLIVIVERA